MSPGATSLQCKPGPCLGLVAGRVAPGRRSFYSPTFSKSTSLVGLTSTGDFLGNRLSLSVFRTTLHDYERRVSDSAVILAYLKYLSSGLVSPHNSERLFSIKGITTSKKLESGFRLSVVSMTELFTA